MTVIITKDQFETAYNASFEKSEIEGHYPLREILRPHLQDKKLLGLGIINGIVFTIKNYHDKELGEPYADLYTSMRLTEAKDFIMNLPESEDREEALKAYEGAFSRYK